MAKTKTPDVDGATTDGGVEALPLPAKREVFLEAIRAGMDISDASAYCGVNRSTTWHWRQEPEFKKLVEQAQAISVETLKQEAHRRAMRGSDRLLEFLLINRAPDEFQPARAKVEVSGHMSISEMSEEDMRAELAALVGTIAVPIVAAPAPEDDDCSDLV